VSLNQLIAAQERDREEMRRMQALMREEAEIGAAGASAAGAGGGVLAGSLSKAQAAEGSGEGEKWPGGEKKEKEKEEEEEGKEEAEGVAEEKEKENEEGGGQERKEGKTAAGLERADLRDPLSQEKVFFKLTLLCIKLQQKGMAGGGGGRGEEGPDGGGSINSDHPLRYVRAEELWSRAKEEAVPFHLYHQWLEQQVR